ncbi:MAG: hypothetical protein KDB01_06420 [Planctomycetaceae bacterium]|nr:hypothetical protein [Planctomycetaceae bacterium]
MKEELLLERFVATRDGAAFESLMHLHGPMVLGVCTRVLRNHHNAEEAFQMTFLILSHKAASIMPRNHIGDWLYGVAFCGERGKLVSLGSGPAGPTHPMPGPSGQWQSLCHLQSFVVPPSGGKCGEETCGTPPEGATTNSE